MPKIFLSHAEDARTHYYGDEALARLRELGEVRLNETGRPLGTERADRAGRRLRGDRLRPPDRRPGRRSSRACPTWSPSCAARSTSATSTSAPPPHAGVLVTRASPGFVDSVAELAVGFMVDLARGISDATLAYRAGGAPQVAMGRQLRGSTLGIIGYGHIGTRLAQLGLALGMRVLVTDPHVQVAEPELRQTDLGTLLAEVRLRGLPRGRDRGDREPDRRRRARLDEAQRLPDQRLARQSGRRGGARGGAARRRDRRLRHGRRPRARPDAIARVSRACRT